MSNPLPRVLLHGRTTGSANVAVQVDASGVVQVSGSGGGGGGDASAANQVLEIAAINKINAQILDLDTGAGTANTVGLFLALPASGGPVAGGTTTNPVNVALPAATVSTLTPNGLTDTQLRASAVPVSVATVPTHAVTIASGGVASGAIASGAVASGAYAAGSISDGADVTMGAKADAKSTATDTTSISAMSVLKQISASVQAPPSQAVTNTGTFATQSAITAASGSIASGAVASGAIASGAVASGAVASGAYVAGSLADGAQVTLGAKADAKNSATDTTSVSVMSVLKQISASVQAPPSQAVTNVTATNLNAAVVGTGTAGTPAGNILTVQGVASMTKLLVTPDSVALPANQSVNLAQVNGTTTVNGGSAAGILAVGGPNATNVAITGNPTNLGAQAVSSENAAVTTARQVQLVADLVGKLIVLPYSNPENFVSGAITSAMSGTTTTSLLSAPASGLRNYITQITVSNGSTTVPTDILIQDGSGGTTLYVVPAPCGSGTGTGAAGATITFPTPLRQPTTATAIFCANVTTGSSTKVSASGYKGA